MQYLIDEPPVPAHATAERESTDVPELDKLPVL